MSISHVSLPDTFQYLCSSSFNYLLLLFLSNIPFSFMMIDSQLTILRKSMRDESESLQGINCWEDFLLGGCVPILVYGLLMFRAFSSSSFPAFVPQMIYFLLSHSGAGVFKNSQWKISSILLPAGKKTKKYLGLLLHIHLTICPEVIQGGELRNLCHSYTYLNRTAKACLGKFSYQVKAIYDKTLFIYCHYYFLRVYVFTHRNSTHPTLRIVNHRINPFILDYKL